MSCKDVEKQAPRLLYLPRVRFLPLSTRLLLIGCVLEIRNRIYDFVADTTTEDLALLIPRQSNHQGQMSAGNSQTWSTFIRQSLGLTQTCQLLRNEFLP